MVGDAKQSIYRFRGAQPEVSRSLSEQLPEASRLSLTTNFRSQGAVLDFVNALFCEAFVEEYKPLRPSRMQLTPLPAIEFLWATNGSEEDDSIPLQLRGAERERYREARFIAQRLASLIDSGQPVVVEGESPRAVRQGDIAILLRSLSDVQVYEEALREQGLDYYLAGGHAFYAQQEVYDVLHLLRSVCSQADELSLAGALRSPLFGLEDETLFWMVLRHNSLHKALSSKTLSQEISPAEQAKVFQAAATLQELRNRKDELLVAELLTLAIELTGYDAVLRSEFLGERKLANLYKLVEQAQTLDRLSPGDLSGFVTQLSEFVARAPKEPVAATTAEGDVIRVMTIHNAKGLEFPVVVIPDLERKAPPTSSQPVFHEELGPLVKPTDESCVGWNLYQQSERIEEQAERIRLLYVACTRAADYLILSSSMKNLDKPESFWTRFLAERFDLVTGRCLATLPPGYAVPQIIVTTSEPISERKRAGRVRGADLEKMVDKVRKLAESGKGLIPEGVAPIPVHHKARKSFSFSRVSGQLRKKIEREVVDETQFPMETSLFDPRDFGTLVHAVLEQSSFSGPRPANSEIHELCQFLAPAHLGQNADEAALEAAELVKGFLKSARMSQLASARCLLKEVDFILPGDRINESLAGRYLEGVIDCLYQDVDENWHLLDYKTNHVTADGLSAEAQHYEMQMFVYNLACEHALGIKPVESILHFLRPGLEYTSQQTEADRSRHVQEICRAIKEMDSAE